MQAIPRAWKEMFSEYRNNFSDLIINEHHLIKKHQIYCLEKLNSNKVCNVQLLLQVGKPIYFEKNFENPELEWKDIYSLPRRATINSNLRIFQYNLLHNILYLNKTLYKFEKKASPSPLCFFAWKSLRPSSSFTFLYKKTFYRRSYSILSKMY